jgi:gamma-glutamyltranspeptidase / glutathione hydrolase
LSKSGNCDINIAIEKVKRLYLRSNPHRNIQKEINVSKQQKALAHRPHLSPTDLRLAKETSAGYFVYMFIRPILVVVLLVGNSLSAAPSVARGKKGAVASVHPLASRAGLATLESEGNAVDAAVAMALTLGVVDGDNSGIGGGCFMLIRRPNGELVAIDGREMAGAAATRDMFLSGGKADPKRSQTGALASGVPGSVAAYAYALKKFGRKKFADLLEPAARLAEEGFPIDKMLAARLKATAEDLRRFEATRAVYLQPDGMPLVEGEVLRQPDLAASYRALAKDGADWFYRGAFAQKVGEWMKANGGILTAADFAGYHLDLREPVRGSYRGCEVVSFPPPSSGGVHVLQILNILAGFDLKAMEEAPRVNVMAEAMKLAFADRAFWLGDPDFVPVPHGLLRADYAKTLAARIKPEAVCEALTHGAPPDAATDVFGRHTTHFSTADAEGNWVACTATLNTSFGSKVVIPGTGILLNNQMDDFSIEPGVPNAFKLVGAEANAIAPGKRPLSSMAPTIVLRDGQPILALGAAGGPTIISQTVINLVGVLDLGLPLDAALAQPRFHHQWRPDEVRIEQSLPYTVIERLMGYGQKLDVVPTIGASNAVGFFDGQFIGVSEPRMPGEALAW